MSWLVLSSNQFQGANSILHTLEGPWNLQKSRVKRICRAFHICWCYLGKKRKRKKMQPTCDSLSVLCLTIFHANKPWLFLQSSPQEPCRTRKCPFSLRCCRWWFDKGIAGYLPSLSVSFCSFSKILLFKIIFIPHKSILRI